MVRDGQNGRVRTPRLPPGALVDSEQRTRAQAFVDLHRDGCFLLPNAWDAGSARILESVGFPAIATTSAGGRLLVRSTRSRLLHRAR
ncbi:isocitrate lyase/phosphoenolpyruvate mutase family protein [Nocardia sp. NPDC055002]